MEPAVDKVRQIVAAYKPSKDNDQVKVIRALMIAVGGCKTYIAQHSSTDRGCAQRIVRELYQALGPLPEFSHFSADKDAAHRLHTRKLAEEEVGSIYDKLRSLVAEQQRNREQSIDQWVAAHPVFGELKSVLRKPLPKSAYLLLFRRGEDDSLELITKQTPDERVFTRVRPHEFKDNLHLHKVYRGKRAVVGAAVIADNELVAVIGAVPPPGDSETQLKTLLSMSKQAADRPLRTFLEGNGVLRQLHEMSLRWPFPKQSHVLLFAEHDSNDTVRTESGGNDGLPDGDVQTAVNEIAVTSEIPRQGLIVGEEKSGTVHEVPPAGEEPLGDGEPGLTVSECSLPLKIVVKTGKDGKVISRFWPSEFSQLHALVATFKDMPAVVGAAVIHDNRLLSVLGKVPGAGAENSQADAVLKMSWTAVEKPYVEFVEQHEVLGGLYRLAKSRTLAALADVVLFATSVDGKVEMMSVSGDNGSKQMRLSLSDFERPRMMHDRFAKSNIVGASVIARGESQSERPRRLQDKGNDPQRNQRHAPPKQSGSKPVVVAAFGRTPLKINIVATPDILKRLGIELDEPSGNLRPPRRHK